MSDHTQFEIEWAKQILAKAGYHVVKENEVVRDGKVWRVDIVGADHTVAPSPYYHLRPLTNEVKR